MNALLDAHRDDPEFGCRLLADEVAEAVEVGEVMVERTAWRIGSADGWWSTFGKKQESQQPACPALRFMRSSAPSPRRGWVGLV